MDKVIEIVEAVHKDMGHYGKATTAEAIKVRYLIPSDCWREGMAILDACIPCQLYKRPQNAQLTATIHPYGIKEVFALWEIDYAGPYVETPRGNLYIITAIEYITSKAFAYPLAERSAEAAIEVLEEIVWTFGKPDEIISDNGEEFRGQKFSAALNRYGIKHNKTSPGHPQTNGKVERLNTELIERLQRITAEEGNHLEDWDLYIRQALFAFAAHKNERLGATPFFLQYGVEPVLPSTSLTANPISRVDRAEAIESRKQHVQDLSKYRTEAAKKYQTALERIASSRDDSYFKSPIILGDLVMREPLNRKSKLHPRWDGPFVILGSSDGDAYQLGTANGYVLKNLVNIERLRKLNQEERKKYKDDFWEASNRLKSQDEQARKDRELKNIDIQLRKATLEHLQAQQRGEPVSLEKHAQLSQERRKKLTQLEATAPATRPAEVDTSSRSGRTRRLPTRFLE